MKGCSGRSPPGERTAPGSGFGVNSKGCGMMYGAVTVMVVGSKMISGGSGYSGNAIGVKVGGAGAGIGGRSLPARKTSPGLGCPGFERPAAIGKISAPSPSNPPATIGATAELKSVMTSPVTVTPGVLMIGGKPGNGMNGPCSASLSQPGSKSPHSPVAISRQPSPSFSWPPPFSCPTPSQQLSQLSARSCH